MPNSNAGAPSLDQDKKASGPLAWIVVMLWLTIMPIIILTIVVFAVCGFALKRISDR
jgi:hypothetical protein